MTLSNTIKKIDHYYSSKVIEYGCTPKGVDWNDVPSQITRFVQLLKIIDGNNKFTINDIGCGYGALYEFMKNKYQFFEYYGLDISKVMIENASNNYKSENVSFSVSNIPESIANYSVASGIFNVKLNAKNHDWLNYIKYTIDIMNQKSNKGFAFNCLIVAIILSNIGIIFASSAIKLRSFSSLVLYHTCSCVICFWFSNIILNLVSKSSNKESK